MGEGGLAGKGRDGVRGGRAAGRWGDTGAGGGRCDVRCQPSLSPSLAPSYPLRLGSLARSLRLQSWAPQERTCAGGGVSRHRTTRGQSASPSNLDTTVCKGRGQPTQQQPGCLGDRRPACGAKPPLSIGAQLAAVAWLPDTPGTSARGLGSVPGPHGMSPVCGSASSAPGRRFPGSRPARRGWKGPSARVRTEPPTGEGIRVEQRTWARQGSVASGSGWGPGGPAAGTHALTPLSR